MKHHNRNMFALILMSLAALVYSPVGVDADCKKNASESNQKSLASGSSCDTCEEECDSKCDDESSSDGNCSSSDEGGCAGDPVIFPSGAYIETKPDMTIRYGATALKVVRYTNAQQSFPDSGLGDQWDSTLSQRIRETGGQATVYLGDTDPKVMNDDGTGNYGRGDFFELTKESGLFVITYDNGLKVYFNSHGNVDRRVLRNGKEYEWLYDNTTIDQKVTKVTVQAPADATATDIVDVTWTTSAPYRISEVTAALSGDTVVFEYDASSRLTKVSGSCGSCGGSGTGAVYTYVAAGQPGAGSVETVSNLENQRQIKNVYDSSSRVITQYLNTDNDFGTFTYEQYNQGVYSFTDYGQVGNEGAEQVFYLDTNGRITRNLTRKDGSDYKVLEKVYDADGNILRQKQLMARPGGTDKWREESFLYDDDGQLTRAMKHDISGAVTQTIVTYQYVRDPAFNNVTRMINADGVITDYDYNAQGLMTMSVFDETGVNLTRTKAYDANGWVTRETSTQGVTTDYLYGAKGHLTKRTVDPTGLAITTAFVRDAAGRATKVIDPEGATTEQFYGSGNQITKRIAAGITTTYLHDAVGRLTRRQITDGTLTRTTDHVYDAAGNMITTIAPSGATTAYAYDLNGKLTYQQSPAGVKTGRTYTPRGEVALQLIHDGTNWVTQAAFQYDLDGNLTRQTDALGNVILKSASYDGYGRLTRQTDGQDGYVAMWHDVAGRVTRSVSYNATDTALTESRMTYDSAGRRTESRQLATPGTTSNADALVTIAYDTTTGRVSLQTRSIDATTTVTSEPTYDAIGRTITQQSDDAPTVAMSYDQASRITRQVVDPAGLAVTSTYAYDAHGRLTRQTQPDNTYTVTFYDGLGQVTKTESYDASNAKFAVFEQAYDVSGQLTRSWQYAAPTTQTAHNNLTDPNTSQLYDDAGRLTATLDTDGNQTNYAYDARGRQVTTTDPLGNRQVAVYDNANRRITSIRIDEAGATDIEYHTAYLYDSLGQLTRTVDQGPDGDITAATDNIISAAQYDALGRVTRTIDPAGIQNQTRYDALGRVTRSVEDAAGIARTTDMVYDRLGQLITLTAYTDSTAGTTEHTVYAYDKAGRQTRVTYPDDDLASRGYVTYTYDGMGRMTRVNHQDNTNTDVVYDALGRRLTLTQGSQVDSFTYKPWGAIATASRGTSANADAVSSVTRVYDALMRLTRESQAIREDAARHVDYTYDQASNVVTLTYPSGTTVTSTFDAIGRADIVSRSGNQIADYDYTGYKLDTLTYETGTNDVALSMAYDGAAGGRLTRMTYAQTGSSGLPDFAYQLDAASNITERSFEHRTGAPAETYNYDSLHRLTKTTFGQRASGTTPYEGFVYDDLGNHLTQDRDGTLTAGLFNAVNEQTKRGTPGSEATVLWDARGNMTRDNSAATGSVNIYIYDRQNMLTRIEDASNNRIASYAYDALGRRIETDVEDAGGDVITRFYYSGSRMIEETDAAATPSVQRKYIWSPAPGSFSYIDDLVQFIDSTGESDAAYFSARHHNYNIVALLDDANGSVVERYDYNPYGQRIVLEADYSLDPDGQSDLGNLLGHQGLMHDAESGLIYNRARYLNAHTGRFMQRDPIGYPDGMNTYAAYHVMRGGVDPAGTESLRAIQQAAREYNGALSSLRVFLQVMADSCCEATFKSYARRYSYETKAAVTMAAKAVGVRTPTAAFGDGLTSAGVAFTIGYIAKQTLVFTTKNTTLLGTRTGSLAARVNRANKLGRLSAGRIATTVTIVGIAWDGINGTVQLSQGNYNEGALSLGLAGAGAGSFVLPPLGFVVAGVAVSKFSWDLYWDKQVHNANKKACTAAMYAFEDAIRLPVPQIRYRLKRQLELGPHHAQNMREEYLR